MFVKRFASATEKTTIADLALEKRKKGESVTKYITRWRNMSMKCEQQLEEEHAVQLLLGNIDDNHFYAWPPSVLIRSYLTE